MPSCTHCFLFSQSTKLVHRLNHFGHRLYLTLPDLAARWYLGGLRVDLTNDLRQSKHRALVPLSCPLSLGPLYPSAGPCFSCSFWRTSCVLLHRAMSEQFSPRQLPPPSPRQLPPTGLLHTAQRRAEGDGHPYPSWWDGGKRVLPSGKDISMLYMTNRLPESHPCWEY